MQSGFGSPNPEYPITSVRLGVPATWFASRADKVSRAPEKDEQNCLKTLYSGEGSKVL